MLDKYLPSNKWVRASMLLVYDICMSIVCAYLALFVRFDLSMNAIPKPYVTAVQQMTVLIIAVTVILFIGFRMYVTMWGGAGVREMIQVTTACFTAAIFQIAAFTAMGMFMPRSYYVLWFLFMTILIGFSRMSYRMMRVVLVRINARRHMSDKKRVMIVGGGQAGTILIRELKDSEHSQAEPVCVIDDDPAKLGRTISGVPVKGTRNDITRLAESMAVDEIYGIRGKRI